MDNSPDDRRAYERECLRETREQLTRVLAAPIETDELRGVRLEGAYPDTAIAVTLWDSRREQEVTKTYSIWRNTVFSGSRGVRESPNQVGMLIATWSLGG
jgi:hypothetical protein